MTMASGDFKVTHDPVYYRDLRVLFDKDRALAFWPSPEQTLEEKVNAAVRCIIYAGSLLYLSTSRGKYIVMAIIGIGLLSFLYSQVQSKESFSPANTETRPTRHPTRGNPFANKLLFDPSADLPEPEWDDQTAAQANKYANKKLFYNITEAAGRHNQERQFMPFPDEDRDAFLKYLAS